MELKTRKELRLKYYNYSTPGAYFVTICTKDRKRILSEIVGDDAHIVPSKYGMLAGRYLRSVNEIEKYVIMPNHIHMIIRFDSGTMWASSPTKSISTVVRSFKTLVTKELGESIFQRSFHDHVIRGEKDYQKIWEYIDTNPIKWADDCYYSE